LRYVVAITGASGSIYGVRLLQELPGERILVMSSVAKEMAPFETGMDLKDIVALADRCYEDDDLFASISSGSYEYDCMFVVPCSESSIGKFANGIADTLISRAVSVCIKEGRRLILVPRETPKSAIMLENELRLARLGVVIMDANPGFYNRPQSVDDIVDFIVGRCLDRAGVRNDLLKRWEGS